MTRTPVAVFLSALVAMAIGCGGGEPFVDQVSALAEPTGALASGDAGLVAQVRKLQAERGLPAQLDGPLGSDADNTAAALSAAFSPKLHRRIAADLEELAVPAGESERRTDFLKEHAELADQAAAAIDLPRCRWDVQHRFGFFGRMLYLDDASTSARLMIVRAIERAEIGKLPESLADLKRALRVAHELATVRRLEARVLGSRLREDALYAAGVMMWRGSYERYEAEQLYGALRDQLAEWPADSRMLVGERATIVHAYEAIRAGMLDSLIVASEKTRLEEHGILPLLEGATPVAINTDQRLCLDTLGVLLEAAGAVGPERRAAVERAQATLEGGQRLFASHLFLGDLPEALRLVAEDRARTEAWTLALASIAELKTPPFRVSPLTGEPYVAERQPDGFAIAYGSGEGLRVELPTMRR